MQRFLLAGFLTFSCVALAQKPVQQAQPWLGVAIDKGKSGVLVKDALAGTPAYEAGLKAGDEITSINGNAVKTPEQMIATVRAQGVGNKVTIKFLRGGKEETKVVKLVARPDELEVLKAKLVGKPAPEFELKPVHGDAPAKLADAKGQVTLIEFWATWCPACRSSHPRLNEFAKKHGKKVKVVAVTNESEGETMPYVNELQPAFAVALDATGKMHESYLVSAIPMLAVIDKAGIVKFATIGAGEYLEEALAATETLLK